jgi:hypothetical protein
MLKETLRKIDQAYLRDILDLCVTGARESVKFLKLD